MKLVRLVSSLILALLASSFFACGGDDGAGPKNDSAALAQLEAHWWEVIDRRDDDCIFFRFRDGELTWILASPEAGVAAECMNISYTFREGSLTFEPSANSPAFSTQFDFADDGRLYFFDISSPDVFDDPTVFFWKADESPNCSGVPPLTDCTWLSESASAPWKLLANGSR